MAAVGTEKLDCKVEVRNYVLVSRPSRWTKSDNRIVVQSPVLQIRNSDIRVPLKRCSREDDNAVEFLPVTDIEKDASYIYDKERVCKTPVCVNAHGVALSDSNSDELAYRRNDKFWIYVGASTDQYKTTVPVINLKTGANGSIDIKKVCWYPKMQGPKGELLTLGGEPRVCRHGGWKETTTFSFAICQKPDGNVSTRTNLRIPTKHTTLPDISMLSSTDQRLLFERRLEIMLKMQSPQYTAPLHQEGIMTPPSSPDSENLSFLKMVTKARPVPTVPPPIASIAETLEKLVDPIRGSAAPLERVLPPVLQTSRIPISSILSTSSLDTSDRGFASVSRELPPLTRSQQPYRRELASFDGDEMCSAQILCDLSRKMTVGRMATASHEIGGIPEDNRGLRFAIMGSDSFTDLCDRGNAECEYAFRFPFKHYHSPAIKCLLSGDSHRHCVSQRLPLPEYFGGCLLMTIPSLGHQCCYWRPEDRTTLPPRKRYLHHEKDQQEENKWRRTICDTRFRTPQVTPSVIPLEREGLTEAGRQLYRYDSLPRNF